MIGGSVVFISNNCEVGLPRVKTNVQGPHMIADLLETYFFALLSNQEWGIQVFIEFS